MKSGKLCDRGRQWSRRQERGQRDAKSADRIERKRVEFIQSCFCTAQHFGDAGIKYPAFAGLAPSRIGEIVSDLEAYLGTTLLYRTTRKISMTNTFLLTAAAIATATSFGTAVVAQNATLDLKFAGALEFSDTGTLFVGDNYSGTI
jgi:hypothetical protein